MMDNIPTEILAHIVSFACTDNGSTARALSLVSRFTRALTLPYTYQSLSVVGTSSIANLLSRLQVVPPHLRRVRHLFLSDWSKAQVLAFAADGHLDDSSDELDRYIDESTAAKRLITLLSPTLESLTFLSYNPFTSTTLLAQVFNTHFPRLAELTIRGFYPYPQLMPLSPALMPNLRTLRLSGNRNPHGLLQMGSLDTCCPRLTSLRIDGLTGALSFARELHEAIRAHESETRDVSSDELFTARLPATLQKIIIQPGPAPLSRCRRSSSALVDGRMMELFDSLLVPCKDGAHRIRFEVLERQRSIYDDYNELFLAWEDALAGKHL